MSTWSDSSKGIFLFPPYTEDDDAKERLKRLAEQQRKLRQAYEQSLETYRRNAAKQERQTLWDTEQISIDMMADGLAKTLDFCAEAGFDTVTTPHAICKTEAEYRQFGRDMSKAAEAAVPYGIKVGIHTTYDHFRVKFDGVTAWDTIFAEASPLLQQQVDTSNTFNVIGDGLLPLLEKYKGRHYSVHLKENVPSATATLGERPKDGGRCIPWKEVLGQLSAEDVAWYVVEAEAIPDSLEPLKNSLAFLKAMM